MQEEVDPRLRWLKPLVIGLGVVFAAMIVVLIVVMITGVPSRRGQEAAAVPSPGQVSDLLTLPRNSRVTDVFAANDRVIVRVRLADGTERLYALDRALRPAGSITLQPER